MVAMIFFTTIQVAFRVFFTAFSWTEEITCFLLVYASLVGTAVAFKRGSHIAVTFLTQRLPGAGQKFLAVGVHLLGIAFFAVMVIYGALLMGTESQQLSPGMQVPMAWVYVAFPAVGAVIITSSPGRDPANSREGMIHGLDSFRKLFLLPPHRRSRRTGGGPLPPSSFSSRPGFPCRWSPRLFSRAAVPTLSLRSPFSSWPGTSWPGRHLGANPGHR